MRRRALVVPLLVVLVMAACGGDDGDSSGDGSSGDDRISVRFMQPIPESMAFYPYFIADELGYFEDENLDVELLPSGETETTLQLAANNIDIGAINPPEILASLESGEDWKVFYDFVQLNVFGIVAPTDSGIDSIEDLKGKTLGITSEGGGELPVVESALKDVGLTAREDVDLLPVGDGGPASAQALEKGQIDAYAAAIQDFVGIQVSGIDLVDITPEKFLNLPSNSMVMQTSVFESEEGQEMAERFSRAWAKATYAGLFDPDFVYEIAKERVPEEASDETFGRPFFEGVLAYSEPPEDVFGELHEDKWTLIEEMLLDVGALEEEIPPDQFLDSAVIDAANDWSREDVEADVEAYEP